MRSSRIVALVLLTAVGSVIPSPAEAGLSAPSSLAAQALSNSVINLTWVDTNTNESGYSIERSIYSTTGFVAIATTLANVSTYRNSGLAEFKTYYYRVRAVHSGSFSSYSNMASATTRDTTPPTIPSGLTVWAVTCTQIGLSWNPSSDSGSGVGGYNVYRNGVFLKQIAPPISGVVSTFDYPPFPATNYYYAVAAFDKAGNQSGQTLSARATNLSCSTATTTTTISFTTTTSTTLASGAPVAKAGPDQFTQTLISITFSGAGSYDPNGIIASYAWTFGDGASATGVSVSHAYAHAGTYTVTLTVTDNSGLRASDTAIANITDRLPVASAGPDLSTLPGTAVSLYGGGSYDPDGTITAYSWAFGDGTSATGMTMSHAYATAGTYTAMLTVTDNNGARASDGAVVTVTAGGSGQLWGKRLGGTSDDFGYTVATDTSGNVVVGGVFMGTVDFGTGPLTSAGSVDVFVAKYSATGTPLWAKRFGGVGDDYLRGLAVDGSGNVVVTGYFTGTADFGTGPLTSLGSTDVFVAKYSASTGAAVWAHSYGGPYSDGGAAVAVDGSGDVIVTGSFAACGNFGGSLLGNCLLGTTDTFLAKYSGSTGAHVWSKNFTSNGADSGAGVAVDSGGNIVLTGSFNGSIDFGCGQLTWAGGGGTDIYLVKLTSAGTCTWSKRYGLSTGSDAGTAVAVDGNGNVFMTGYLIGPVDVGTGALHNGLYDYFQDGFLAKYSSAGAPLWSLRFGGDTNFDSGTAVAVDSAGNVAVTGYFQDTMTVGSTVLTGVGSTDLVVAKFSAAGTPLWAKSAGSTSDDGGSDVAFDGGGNVLVAGYFRGTVTLGGASYVSAGYHDVLLCKLAP